MSVISLVLKHGAWKTIWSRGCVKNPDHLIFCVEANDLNSKQSLGHIAKSIADLAASLKNENQNVSVCDN